MRIGLANYVGASNSSLSVRSFLVTPSPVTTIADACKCCGTVLKYPSDVLRVRCLVCQTTFTIKEWPLSSPTNTGVLNNSGSGVNSPNPSTTATIPQRQILISYNRLRAEIQNCQQKMEQLQKEADSNTDNQEETPQPNPHLVFKPVQELVFQAFANFNILNNSFKLNPSGRVSYHSPNLNYEEIKKFYSLLQNLPTKRPFYAMLQGCLQLLKFPPNITDPSQLNWLLILLEIPILSDCLISANSLTTAESLPPELKSSGYEILKRVVGLLSYLERRCAQFLTHWWSRLPNDEFIQKVEFFNLYITFHLTRCINFELFNGVVNKGSNSGKYLSSQTADDDINYKDQLNSHFIRPVAECSDFGLSISIPLYISRQRRGPNPHQHSVYTQTTSNQQETEIKIRLQQYGDDWHLRTAGRVASYLFLANKDHKKFEET
ncbi:unnamed protein product [Ambrosiozyma monospora]|uniref:Unnamed protein product n=1 Tax=Ambrosiozyma monospora TaxID=43982 RepID=A0ACB5U2C3_AMBMO|nr:unnamed protein product [Ambrosiozyma monospora]